MTDQRFALPNDVAPGSSVKLHLTVTAPFSEGPYVLSHRVVKEEVAVGKRKVHDTQTVAGDVRREDVVVESTGKAKVRNTSKPGRK